MIYTTPSHVVTGSSFWYAESLNQRVWLGIVRNDNGMMFVRAVATSYDMAMEAMLKIGEVEMISPLSEILAGLSDESGEIRL